MKTMIEPGPELDAKVAQACGIALTSYGGFLGRPHVKQERQGELVANTVDLVEWSPSRDLNAAFEAAEKVGLFNYGSLEKVGYLWRFCSSAFPTRLQSSPALAICDGVIALVESRREFGE